MKKIIKIKEEIPILKQEIIDNQIKEIKEMIKKKVKIKMKIVVFQFHKKEKFIKKI